MRLSDKVAIISGAGAGIGREAARRFAAEGCSVAAVDRDADAAAATVDAVETAGGKALAVTCDVTEPEDVEAAVRATVERFGRLDVVYANAGGSSDADGAVHEVEIDEWWRTVRVDLFGTFLLARYGIRALLDQGGGGSVITTTSAAALVGVHPGRSCYSAAKGGVVSLTRAMAASYAPHGIRVNAISPGGTATERIKASFARRGRDLPDAGDAVPGINDPQDIVNAALFLASDEARTITGQVLAVDGGSTTLRNLSTGGVPR